MLLLDYGERAECLVPMVGEQFKSYFSGGGEAGPQLVTTAYLGGQTALREPLYVLARGESARQAIHRAFRQISLLGRSWSRFSRK